MSEAVYEIVSSVIEKEKENLQSLSMEIWNKPELCYKEVHAHSVLTEALDSYGFQVQKHYLLETAFRAEYSNGVEGPVVAVLCEYDALPDIGHACGHNLIAECGVAAAIGIQAAMRSNATLPGKVVVLGCPAEEGGGGKIRLLEQGAFQDVDIALMAHPADHNRAYVSLLCSLTMNITYKGKESHASAYPWDGRNALDAAVSAYVNIGLLRQHIKSNCRIHGIITKGGSAPNVIPNETKLHFYLRAPSSGELMNLKERVKSCFESAALATGCEVECEFDQSGLYLNIISNKILTSLFREYSESMGVKFEDDTKRSSISASSDMGNVSYEVPSIQPMYCIGPFENHTQEFTKLAATDDAHRVTRTTATALALVALTVLQSPDLLQRCRTDFQEDLVRMKLET